MKNKETIHSAIQCNNNELAKKIIQNTRHTDILNTLEMVVPPLILAIDRGNTEIALTLIEKCTNVNISDNYGNTLLHIAAITGNIPIILALINKGAQVNTRNISKALALDLARSTNYSNKQEILDAL